MYRKVFGILMTLFMVLLLLSALACNSGAADKTDEDDGVETKESILKAIDETWETLGYTAKPGKYIAISFDDGPAGTKTADLLAVLEEKKVPATFFLIGQNIRNQQSSAQAIYDAGHELANHSDGYNGLGGTTAEDAIRTSLEKASLAIKAITGTDPVYFRAPNVDYGDNLARVCRELNLAIIGVSCWSNDWQSGITAETITANVLNAAQDGGIINCHEPNTAPNTVSALPGIIDGLREKGFWIMTVGQLALVKGKTLEAGTRYDSIK